MSCLVYHQATAAYGWAGQASLPQASHPRQPCCSTPLGRFGSSQAVQGAVRDEVDTVEPKELSKWTAESERTFHACFAAAWAQLVELRLPQGVAS